MIDALRMRLAVATVVVALASLAGCSGGLRSDAPAVQTYYLRVASAMPAPSSAPAQGSGGSGGSAAAPGSGGSASARATSAGSLQVIRPQFAPGLASDAIVVVQPDRRLDTFAASRWPAPLPDVVESLVMETLRSRSEFATVVDSRSAFPADWLLQVRIRRFEAEYASAGGVPRAVVALDCTLGRRSDREIVASFTAEGAAQAADNRLGAVVAALEQAAGMALDVIAARSAETVRTSRGPLPP